MRTDDWQLEMAGSHFLRKLEDFFIRNCNNFQGFVYVFTNSKTDK